MGLPNQGNGIASSGKRAVFTGQYLSRSLTLGNIQLKGAGSGNFFAAGF
jgi:hypothetical protein